MEPWNPPRGGAGHHLSWRGCGVEERDKDKLEDEDEDREHTKTTKNSNACLKKQMLIGMKEEVLL